MDFELVGLITAVETIAAGGSIRELARLCDTYGEARWRKKKGTGRALLGDGLIHRVELHWYEAHGIGRVEMKIKRFLD